MNFIDKTCDVVVDKVIVATIVWTNNQFFAKVNNVLYYIDLWDSLVGTKKVYSLPTNDYHSQWTEKPVTKPDLHNDPVHHSLDILYWGKYKPNMRIKGVLKNNVFYDKQYSRSNIKKS